MISTYLIVCPLVFIAGFIDAIAGGGGLISLPAYLLSGLPIHNAIATNKLSSSMGTTSSTLHYGKKGYINWKSAPVCVFFSLLGASIGSKCALLIPERIFTYIMLGIIPLTAFYILKNKNFDTKKESFDLIPTIFLCSMISLLIGFYDGFYGPGTGTFLLVLLTGLARLSLNEAAGTTKIINLTSNYTALTVYLLNGKTYLLLGIIAGLFCIAGNLLGAHAFSKNGTKFFKPFTILVLGIFLFKITLELFL